MLRLSGTLAFHHLLGRESPPCLLNAVQTHLLVPPFYITGKKPEIHSVRVTRPRSHTGLPTRLTTSVPFLLASSSNLHPLRAASLCHREQPLQAHECQSIKTDKREKGTKLVGPCVLLGQPKRQAASSLKPSWSSPCRQQARVLRRLPGMTMIAVSVLDLGRGHLGHVS